jgi:hypothetical protein
MRAPAIVWPPPRDTRRSHDPQQRTAPNRGCLRARQRGEVAQELVESIGDDMVHALLVLRVEDLAFTDEDVLVTFVDKDVGLAGAVEHLSCGLALELGKQQDSHSLDKQAGVINGRIEPAMSAELVADFGMEP